jgi:hypothetical protein
VRERIVLIPSEKIRGRHTTSQRLVAVSSLGGSIERQIDRAPHGEAHELGAHAPLGRCDTLEIPSTPVIQLDEELLHMELNIPAWRRRGQQARGRRSSTCAT